MIKKFSFFLIFAGFLASCHNPAAEDFFVFLHPIPDRPVIPEDSVMKLQQGHIRNINRLHSEGKLTAAGPFERGGGLFFLKAMNLAEAQANLNTDPAVQAGRFNIEIHPLLFVKGSVCKLDSAIEMTNYQFLYFKSLENKQLTSEEKEIYDAAIDLLESKILLEGYFPDTQSRIIITDTTGIESFGERINAISVPFKKIYDIETKSLWIARGTFCE